MTQTIEFSYKTNDGRFLDIIGETDGLEMDFKAFENGKKISKNTLNTLDFYNIREFIELNSEPDIEDFHDLDYRHD
jgi:hypothetical protein